MHPDKNPVLRLVRRVVPSTDEYDGQKLFTRKTGKLLATPLFAVLILVETTDVVFAVDSIPAILAVSREPFIVFASNAFAILGLRALYFLLAGMAGRFRYLNVGLGVILAFVGLKMILVEVIHLPTWVSLAFITVVLTVTILTSLRAERRDPRPATAGPLRCRRRATARGRAGRGVDPCSPAVPSLWCEIVARMQTGRARSVQQRRGPSDADGCRSVGTRCHPLLIPRPGAGWPTRRPSWPPPCRPA